MSLVLLLCAWIVGCAKGTGSLPATSRTASSVGGFLESDEDRDLDDAGNRSYSLKPSDKDSFVAENEGSMADPTDRQAISALVRRYYAAAAAEDAALACSLLASMLSAGFAESPGGGHTCAAGILPVLRAQHAMLAGDEVATMTVVEVRIKGDAGTVTVGFKTKPVGTIAVRRDGAAWKLNALFATGLS